MAYHDNSPQEPEQTFEHPDGVWKRTGYCCRCGQCCWGDFLDRTDNLIDGQVACHFLRKLEDGSFMCSDRTEHNGYYQMACRVFPQHPSEIANYPSCTYRFVRVSD